MTQNYINVTFVLFKNVFVINVIFAWLLRFRWNNLPFFKVCVLFFFWPQEQVEQNLREKDRLQEELHLMRSENETLRGALQKQQKETASFKVYWCALKVFSMFASCATKKISLKWTLISWHSAFCFTQEWNDQKEEERSKLTYQMDQIKAENEKLKNALQLQQQENKQLKVCLFFIHKISFFTG